MTNIVMQIEIFLKELEKINGEGYVKKLLGNNNYNRLNKILFIQKNIFNEDDFLFVEKMFKKISNDLEKMNSNNSLFKFGDYSDNKPILHLESNDVNEKNLAREFAIEIEKKSYQIQLKERDDDIEFNLLNEDSSTAYCSPGPPLELTINLGQEVISASYILTLIFKGLIVGIFSMAGKDIYIMLKEKFFKKKKQKIFLLVLQIDTRFFDAKRGAFKIYIEIRNSSELEKLPNLLKELDNDIEQIYNSGLQEIQIKFSHGRWEQEIKKNTF